MISHWVDTDNSSFDEEALLIYGISYNDAMDLGAKYKHKSIIVKDYKCFMEVVLADGLYNIRRAWNLKGIYEVHPPRPSYFQTVYSIVKVFENKHI